MEVLPCSDVQYERELNGFDSGKQVQIPNGQRFGDEFPLSGGQSGAFCSDSQLEGRMFSVDSHDFEDDDPNGQDFGTHITVDTDQSNYRDGEAYLSATKWLERDESVALWMKWRGKWQAGIRCARADLPLSILKAKPKHEWRKYCAIFFPYTKNYSWADMLYVRSINELPEPIAYRNHNVGLKLVKDLTAARLFITKKLAFGILNILNQFHAEALIDSACDAKGWKDFALEVSQCKGYSELGRMLLKLQSIIMQRYLRSEWLQQSLSSWFQRCQVAQSADVVESLSEELFDSILWNEVNVIRDGPVQSSLGAEWKTWKQDMMKLSVTSHSIPDDVTPSTMFVELSRKRPKLEVRRAEPHAFRVETSYPLENDTVEFDYEFFNNRKTVDAITISSELLKDKELHNTANTCLEIVVGAAHSGQDVEMTLTGQNVPKKFVNGGNRSRQCTAFVELKGRQCERWANERDVYCSAHLASRYANSVQEEATPLRTQPCEGTTVHGTKCKHRALPGSSFCKKHIPKLDSRGNVDSSPRILKRKHDAVAINGKLDNPNRDSIAMEMRRCIGASRLDGNASCLESPKHYSLYCEDHIPSWLKHARNGGTRIISKDVFTDLLNGCQTIDQKLNLHQACELFYKLFKSIQSLRNTVSMDVQLDWALFEASKSIEVGKLLLKLVCTETDRLRRTWAFAPDEGKTTSSSIDDSIRCKVCSQEFVDDRELGIHFMDKHKKEARLHFGGYACAICLDAFTSKEAVETHVQERHHVSFVEQCMLLRCNPCRGHFGNKDELWEHIFSFHPRVFRLKKGGGQQNLSQINVKEVSVQKPQPENYDRMWKFTCKFCGMKFDLLPDLGRHHQAAHIEPSSISADRSSTVKKGLKKATYRTKNRGTAELVARPRVQATAGILAMSECSEVAKKLFGDVKKTKLRPSNLDILAAARTACCNVSLKASLEVQFGMLPDLLFLKAAKICSEHNVEGEWHRDGFVCPRGCRSFKKPGLIASAMPRLEGCMIMKEALPSPNALNNSWEVDECHLVINLNDIREVPIRKAATICRDISSGKESFPVACVVDDDLLDSLQLDAKTAAPWESFEYITHPLLRESDSHPTECLNLGCACPSPTCCSGSCDHVYLFDNDYEDAKDVHGKSMHGRFPYDDKGRIVLEEGYLVYECNDLCSCNKTCPNRVLQKGVKLRLEVFWTVNKGWGVRAGEPILRGMFICEYVGEVLDEEKAKQRRDRCGEEGCDYMFNAVCHTNDMSRLNGGVDNNVIDAAKYGNVSRFINHSCSPNLVSCQVIVNSMDPRRAHIGLYANQDIALGEELTFDYGYELLPEGGRPCLCGSSTCRGRLY